MVIVVLFSGLVAGYFVSKMLTQEMTGIVGERLIAQARMIVGGRYVHRSLFEKAAAYGYHLCMNHPFVDGNKRVALVLMDLFLQRNGWEIIADEEEAYGMVMHFAAGNLGKAELAIWLKEHSAKVDRG